MSLKSANEIEVVRYYLKCEVGKLALVDWQPKDFVERVDQAVDRLCEEDASRLAKVLACYYRNNPLCSRLGNHISKWRIQEIPCNQIRLSQIKTDIDPFLDRFGFNLERFVQFMKAEGAKEERLMKEFPVDSRELWHSRIICEPYLNQIQILDGSHRAVILALKGNSKISCYVGY